MLTESLLPTIHGGQESQLLKELAGATLMGFLGLVNTMSAAGVIFSGPAEHLLPRGLAILLYSTAFGPLVVSLMQPGAARVLIVTPDNLAVPFMAHMVGDLLQVTNGPEVFSTVAISMVICTASVGAAYTLVGAARLGHLVQHIPAPVVSGYLVSVGSLIIDTGVKLQLECHIKELECIAASPTKLPSAIAVCGGVTLYALQRATRGHPAVLPMFLVCAVVSLHFLDWRMPTLMDAAWWLPTIPSGAPAPWFWPNAASPGGPLDVRWADLLPRCASTVVPLTVRSPLFKRLLYVMLCCMTSCCLPLAMRHCTPCVSCLPCGLARPRTRDPPS